MLLLPAFLNVSRHYRKQSSTLNTGLKLSCGSNAAYPEGEGERKGEKIGDVLEKKKPVEFGAKSHKGGSHTPKPRYV